MGMPNDMTTDELFNKMLEGFRDEAKFIIELREILSNLFVPGNLEECYKQLAEDLAKGTNDDTQP